VKLKGNKVRGGGGRFALARTRCLIQSASARRLRLRLSVETGGFSYAAWEGPFNPADLTASQMLAYYAERLPAIEIDNIFYRLPRQSVLEGWVAQVPEQFRFAVKASDRTTHQKRLRDVEDETRYLLDVAHALADRLGEILFLPMPLPPL